MNATTTQCRSQYQVRESLQNGMGYVVPYAWNDYSGSGTEQETETGFERTDNSFPCAEFDFNFSSPAFSETEQAPFFPSYMSPADELFQNGKIRPLRPIAQLQALSISEEQSVIAQMQAREDRAFKCRRPLCVYSSISAPASPVNPPSNENWCPEREPTMAAGLHIPNEEKKQAKRETIPIASDQTSSHHVLYRRCRSLPRTNKVFHVNTDARNIESRYEMEESRESSTVTRGGASAKSKLSSAGKTHKSRTLKELLHREDMRKHLTNMLAIRPRRVETRTNEEVRKKEGGPKLPAAQATKLLLPEQWRWNNKDRSVATWARSPKGVSPHERLYTAQRAQADKMRKKTFLPYRPGLLGCLGFNKSSQAVSFRATHSHLPNSLRQQEPSAYRSSQPFCLAAINR